MEIARAMGETSPERERKMRPGRVLAASLLAGFTVAANLALAANPTFFVRYRSAGNVYVDGGKSQGLSIGDRLVVMSGSETVGELEVIYVADQSASCRVVSEKRSVRAGDSATVAARGEAAPSPSPSPTATASPAPGKAAPTASTPLLTAAKAVKPSRPWARVRGGVSLGLYKVWDTSGSNFNFEQRTGRLDLSLYDIGGQPFSFNARFRSRQDVRALSLSSVTPLDERQDRLYELSLRYEPPSDNVSLELGRLGSSRFSGVDYLDGGLVRIRLASPVQIGGFFGRNADVEGVGLPGYGQKYGGFLRVSPRSPYSGSYDVVVAIIREFAQTDISREYVSVESRFGSGAVTFFERGEIDLNNGWRRALVGQPYQLSNISVFTNVRFSPAATMVLSYDSRRNYRDFFTRDVPERIFDDLLHQGFRGSLYFGKGYGLNVTAGAGLRLREGDTAQAFSWNAGIRHGNLFSKDVILGADLNTFQNSFTDGYLVTAQAGKRFRGVHQLDLSYGRTLYRVKATDQIRRTEYFRFAGRASVTRHVYALTDFEYDRGDDLRGPRGYFEIGYQF